MSSEPFDAETLTIPQTLLIRSKKVIKVHLVRFILTKLFLGHLMSL